MKGDMKKITMMRIIAEDKYGLLRDEESRFGYWLKRMYYKLVILVKEGRLV